MDELRAKLVRGTSRAEIKRLVDAALAAGTPIADIFVLAFQTRDIREGRGERELFRHLLLALAERDLDLVKAVIPLIPVYGCWGDVSALAKTGDIAPALQEGFYMSFVEQLKADEKTLLCGKRISMCAKWAPREGQAGAMFIAYQMFKDEEYPTFSVRMKHYRQLLTALNRRLRTVEVKMCAGKWDDIYPEYVPKRASEIYAQAFVSLEKAIGDPRRMVCRERFLNPPPRSEKAQVLTPTRYDAVRQKVTRLEFCGRSDGWGAPDC